MKHNNFPHYTLNQGQFNKFLEEHGIRYLTGKACAMGIRGLYDLTEQGSDILSNFLGGCTPTFPNWNSGAVKSAFIAYATIRPLVAFILGMEWECVVDVEHHGHGFGASYLIGCQRNDWQDVTDIVEAGPTGRNYRTWYSNRAGNSNKHQMSGRRQ
jgi:hypothetical protein